MKQDMLVVFETERLVVRHFNAPDYNHYFLLHGNPAVMQFIRPVKTKEESDAFLNESLTANIASYLGRWSVDDKSTGKFAGSFVMIPIPDDKEKIQLGYAFLPAHWGKGFATEVTEGGLQYFRNKTPLTEIYAVTEAANVASQRVLIKNGFQAYDRKMEGEKELIIYIFRR